MTRKAALPVSCRIIATGSSIPGQTVNTFPPKEKITRLATLNPKEEFLDIENGRKVYQQFFYEDKDKEETTVILIPVYIEYKINSDFLVPFVFLGRYQSLFSFEDLKDVKPYANITGGYIKLTTAKSSAYLVALKGLPLDQLRKPVRRGVILLLLIGIFSFLLLARVYSLIHWYPKYKGDLFMLGWVILIRIALAIFDVPGNYIKMELFSPILLAFNDIFAPNLGDFTLNVFTVAFGIWILYKNLFRYLAVPYRTIFKSSVLKWTVAALTVATSCVLLWFFYQIFALATENSHINLDVSNIRDINFFSLVFLVDMGVILISIIFLMMLLLRYNILLGEKLGYPNYFILGHLAFIIGFNLLFDYQTNHVGEWLSDVNLLITLVASVSCVMIVLYRIPNERIFRYDLPNYIILIFLASIVSAHCVLDAVDVKNRLYLSKLGEKVLENRKKLAKAGFFRAQKDQEAGLKNIIERYEDRLTNDDFVLWLNQNHLSKSFEAFDRKLFVYDSDWTRMDPFVENEPLFDPRPDSSSFSLAEIGAVVVENEPLYQLTAQGSGFADTYIAEYEIPLKDSLEKLHVFLELSSNPYDIGSISPFLLVNVNTYEDERFFSQFDFGLYKLFNVQGKKELRLSTHSGSSSFKSRLPIKYLQENPFFQDVGNHVEYVRSSQDVGEDRKRVLMAIYKKSTITEIFTTFSFIFYFYSIALILLVILPTLIFRLARFRFFLAALPLRTKIRMGLLAVSIMPILAIIVFLFPFINNRYETQARDEINEQTKKVTQLLKGDIIFQTDRIAKQEYQTRIKETLDALRVNVPNDINVYDEDGQLIGSSQIALFKDGINSGLMNSEAHALIREGAVSNLVLEESIGRLDYLSGYQPVMGDKGRPAGFVNVAFQSIKEEMNDQVLNLMTYLANIYLLAFLLVGIFAVILSNTITQPLSLIQERLATTRLGNENKPIDYKSNDEIGEIVSSYNTMLEKLASSENNLKATQRQLAWRQMARQVAHEIKNPLTPMRLSIQHITRTWKGKGDKFESMFPKVMKTLLFQIDSLVNIANSFSQFASMPEPVKADICLNEIIINVIDLYGQSDNISCKVDIPHEEFRVFADPDQLSRALGNIVKNGIQAMEEEGDIELVMKVETDLAQIEIRDNGTGMSEDIKSRIFEPNFSTKTSGMGLGLAIVKRIIESFGGSITFESTQGVGTTFFIELPSTQSEYDRESREIEETT